jgi:cellulose synthase/poly-beta-1,6-N-acetylglucosamine synthase-like glycosyltransferase
VSARNEQKDIAWKIKETLAWDYPADKLELLIASDASDDGTDEIVNGVKDARLRFIRLEKRSGKNQALNNLFEISKGELLFFTDANSHIDAGCLRRVVNHFSHPQVGCVTGTECTIRENEETAVVAGTRAFLGYESFVNSLESRLGSVLVCDGSIFCLRRSLFHPLQPELANDFELPIRAGFAGQAVLFDPTAISLEKATSSPIEEFRRKRRICGQGMLGFLRMRGILMGFRRWQFLSRKLLRWFGPVPLGLILVSSLLLWNLGFYKGLVLLQAFFYLLGLAGWAIAASGKEGSRLTTLPFYFLMVNMAAMTGAIEGMFGKKYSVWESPAKSRGTHPVQSKAGQLPSEEASLTSVSRD